MTYKRTPNVAYHDQKKSAIKRGIGWHFTFDQWINWWEVNLGSDWFKKRGHHTGQYVMARNKDKGPYASWNVRCAKVEENHREFNAHKGSQLKAYRKRLSREEVIEIYTAHGCYVTLATRFNLNVHTVHRIKCRKCYKQITQGLAKGGRL